MIKRLKISTKLIINFLISALVAISIIGAFSFYHFNSLLNKSVEERLELMKIEKK